MQKLRIDVTKIPKEAIFVGKKGKYVTLILHENRNGPDQYANDGFAALEISKEEREAGDKGAIVGNWKHLGQKPEPRAGQGQKRDSAPPAAKPKPPSDPDLDPDETSRRNLGFLRHRKEWTDRAVRAIRPSLQDRGRNRLDSGRLNLQKFLARAESFRRGGNTGRA